jgi:hypothetical protein
MVDFFHILRSFDDEKKFTGENFQAYKREFQMTFQVDGVLWAIITGVLPHPSTTVTSPPPSKDSADSPAPASVASATKITAAQWEQHSANAASALYKTIKSDAVRAEHIKDNSTGPEIWKSLLATYQRDSRATRFEYKAPFYNPIHDPTLPVDDYVSSVVRASERLGSIGHPPPPLEIVDSVIMHVHPSFATARSILMAQTKEPTLEEVRAFFNEFERDMKLQKTGGPEIQTALLAEAQALAAKVSKSKSKSKEGDSKETRRSKGHRRHSLSDDDGEGFDWLNTQGGKGCHRCGRDGHRSSRCMATMPQHVKDQIMEEAKSHHVRIAESSDEGSENSGGDWYRANVARIAGNTLAKARNPTTAFHASSSSSPSKPSSHRSEEHFSSHAKWAAGAASDSEYESGSDDDENSSISPQEVKAAIIHAKGVMKRLRV